MSFNGASLFYFDKRLVSRLRSRKNNSLPNLTKRNCLHQDKHFPSKFFIQKSVSTLSDYVKDGKQKNFCLIGIDEVGRGSWAGPVVAAAVVLPPDFFDPLLNDSKKLTPEMRLRLCEKLKKVALYSTGSVNVQTIDSINILSATHLAMKNALDNLIRKNPSLTPDLVLVDGLPVPDMGFPQKSIIKGDSKSAAIAAASIIAKVTRDKTMIKLHKNYPLYGLSKHKGYGTSLHWQNLLRWGPSPIHRRSFSPVRQVWDKSVHEVSQTWPL